MKTYPGSLVDLLGGYTTQVNRGYNKPLQGFLLNNQYFMESKAGFFRGSNVFSGEDEELQMTDVYGDFYHEVSDLLDHERFWRVVWCGCNGWWWMVVDDKVTWLDHGFLWLVQHDVLVHQVDYWNTFFFRAKDWSYSATCNVWKFSAGYGAMTHVFVWIVVLDILKLSRCEPGMSRLVHVPPE